MYRFLLLAIALCLAAVEPASAAPADVAQSPSCRHCGMDRGKFGQSRMVIEYEDGSAAATCSLHFTAVELAITLPRGTSAVLSVLFFVASMVFVWRSFYGMRIKSGAPAPAGGRARAGAVAGGK